MKSLWSVLRPRLSWGQMVFCIKHSHFLSPMTVLASKLEVPTNLVLISLFFVPVAWASKSLNWNCFVVPSYPACLSESASLLWNPWLAEFLIWKVKPRPGNHFCFFGLALPQIGRWGKTSTVAISQPPPCHNQFQGRLLLMPSLHLMSSRGRFAAACQQPVWAAPQLHSRSPPPSWNSLLPLPARSGSRLVDKVRGGARGESNPTIILTCLTMVLHPLHAPTPPPCLYDLPFSPQPPFFATLKSKLPSSNLSNPSLSLLLRIHWRQAFYRESLWAEREMWQFGQMSFSFILKISFSWQSGSERWNQICKCCSSSRLKGGQISNDGQLRGDVKNQLRRSTSLLMIGNQCQNWISSPVLLSTNNCSQ